MGEVYLLFLPFKCCSTLRRIRPTLPPVAIIASYQAIGIA